MYFLGNHNVQMCLVVLCIILCFSFTLTKFVMSYHDSLRKETFLSNRYFSLINNIKEVLICLDEKFNIIYVSKPFIGRDKEYLNQNIKYFEFINASLLKESIENGILCNWSWEDQLNQRFYQFSGSKIANSDESDTILIICHDVTDEHISKENELRMIKAETALKSKIEFIASISHELRNPLQAAIYSCENLTSLNLDNEQKAVLNDIQSSNQLLSSIIDDVLDFSKIEAGKMIVHFSPMNILKVCEFSLELNFIEAKKKDLNLYFIFDLNAPLFIDSDHLRVVQILNNLISNAIKYSLKGDIFITLSLMKKNDQEYIKFSVKDQGIGIAQEDIEKLFSPFQIFNRSGKNFISKSWGLGLSICKKLSILLNSNMTVESELGKGSTFFLEIPVVNSSTKIIENFKLPILQKVQIFHRNKIYMEFLKLLFEQYNVTNVEGYTNLEENSIQENTFVIIDEYLIPKELKGNGIILGEKKVFNYQNINYSSRILNLFKEGIETLVEKKPTHKLQNKKFLICEDNQIIHKSLLKMLQSLEIKVIESAFDGVEAVEKSTKTFYDFILMDIQMPNKNGLDATIEIRKLQESFKEKSTIVCISGNAIEKTDDVKERLKFNEILSKPITKNQLIESIEKFI